MTALRFEVGCPRCGAEVRFGGGSAGCESRPVACTEVRRQVVCRACRAEFVVAAVMLPINRQDAQQRACVTAEQVAAARAQGLTVADTARRLGITERRAYRLQAKSRLDRVKA